MRETSLCTGTLPPLARAILSLRTSRCPAQSRQRCLRHGWIFLRLRHAFFIPVDVCWVDTRSSLETLTTLRTTRCVSTSGRIDAMTQRYWLFYCVACGERGWRQVEAEAERKKERLALHF